MALPHRLIAAWLLALACSPGWADPLATQAALDAFFSISAAQVEGAPATEPPAGFAGAQAEEGELIEFLGRQRKRGADLNAYRHLGTPLHHAIRAGMTETALWLLKNGADPQLVTAGEGSKLDALGIAIHAGQWEVLDVLVRQGAYARLAPRERASRYWPLAMADGERATALTQRRFALPRFDNSPEVARALLLHSLCTAQLGVARALLEAEPQARPAPDWSHACRGAGAAAPARALPPLAEWQALEQRLQWPVLPYVLAQARTPAQLREALAAGLRRPWDDPAATASILRRMLQADPQPSAALLQAVPPVALKAALQDEASLRLWLQKSALLAPAELEWALSQVEPQRLTAQLPHILGSWNYAATTRREAKDRAGRLARWWSLTRRLTAPLPATSGGVFAYSVPLELWPQWFALGQRMPDEDWASWLLWADLSQLKEAWPALAKHQTAVAQRALTWLVAPLSVGTIDDPVAQRHSYGGGAAYWSDAHAAKLLFLHGQGLRVAQPRWLGAGFAAGDSLASLEPVLRLGLVKTAPPALRNQVVRQSLRCEPAASPALRRALAEGQGSFDALQPLARPGQAQCLWVASGGEPGGRRFIDDEDFLTGVQRLTPCADGNMTASVWQEESRSWAELKEAPVGGWIAVHAPALQQEGLLSFGQDQGTCGNRQGGLYQVRFGDKGAPEMVPLQPGQPLFDALALQCDFTHVEACAGLGTGAAEETGLAVNAFADRFWAQDKKAFFAALDVLDRETLRRVRDDGLFPHWLDEAARRVSASRDLVLAEKRRRMAWLLAQRPLLRGLSGETLEALAGWLPAEDWGPVTESLRCAQPFALQLALQQAQQRKLPAVERRIRLALASRCG